MTKSVPYPLHTPTAAYSYGKSIISYILAQLFHTSYSYGKRVKDKNISCVRRIALGRVNDQCQISQHYFFI